MAMSSLWGSKSVTLSSLPATAAAYEVSACGAAGGMVFLWAGTLVVGAPFAWDEGEIVMVSLTRSPLNMFAGNYEWPFLSSVRVTELTLFCTIPLPTPLLLFSILLSERSTCQEGTKRIYDMLPRLWLILYPSLRMCYFFFMSSFSLFCIN